MKHVEHLIDHLLDDRLSPADADALHEHCRGCAECAQRLRDAEVFLQTLAVDRTPNLGHSVWPDVQARVARPASPLERLTLVFGGFAAVAAGLVLGLWLAATPTAELTSPTLLDQSIVLAGDSSETLDQLLLAAWQDEGETQ